MASPDKQAFESIPARLDSAHGPSPTELRQRTSNLHGLSGSAHLNDDHNLLQKSDETPVRKRDRWKSRPTFVLASVGAAIGLGNVWRFPYLAFKHGGGAFWIPYIIALFCTGLPLLVAELALGRFFQRGNVMAFGMIHKRVRGVGAISVLGGFGIVCYYSTIIAWALYFLGASFKWPLPWATQECPAGSSACRAEPSRMLPLQASNAYFQDTVLKSNRANLDKGVAENISGPLYGTLLLVWLCAYLCIYKGVRSVGAAVRFTVFVPWILLAILIAYNATLPGSIEGVKAYIGTWDVDALSSGSAWSDAAGQVFFSLGSTLGIMSAYGSYAPMVTDVYADSSIVAYADTLTSLFCGFAVFSILGNMAYRQREIAAGNPALRVNICEGLVREQSGLADAACAATFDCSGTCASTNWNATNAGECCGDVAVRNVAQAGIYLAFSVYPATMQYLGAGGANILSILWFGTLFTLGIDSMFAMVEGLSTILADTPRFAHVSKERVALWTCAIGFMASVAFVTDLGIFLVDACDHYILNYGLFVVGALEAYVIGWVWAWPETMARCGLTSATIFNGGFTAAALVGCAIAGGLHDVIATGANLGIGVALGAIIFGASCVLGFLARQDLQQTFGQWAGIMALAGTRNLRNTFKYDPAPWERVMHIVTFDVTIKYICPPALLGLFINTAVSDANGFTNGYEDYPDWVHVVVGLLILGSMFGLLLLFGAFPGLWDRVAQDDREGHIEKTHAERGAARAHAADDLAGRGASTSEENPYVPQLPREPDGWANDAPLLHR